jgi:hypothetical protein
LPELLLLLVLLLLEKHFLCRSSLVRDIKALRLVAGFSHDLVCFQPFTEFVSA